MARPSKPKKSFLKKMLLATAVLAGLFLLAMLIVPRMIHWDRIQQQAEEKISAALHHKVTIGKIGFHLLKGIEVRDLVIANGQGFSEKPFLSDEAAVVQYRLLPLLFGKVVIKAVVLEKPQVLIEKQKDGTFNFSDMIPSKEKPAGDNATEKGKSALSINLLVAKFSLTDAQLIYQDHGQGAEYRIESLNLTLDNLTLAGVTPVGLKLAADVTALEQTYPVAVDAKFRLDYFKETFVLDALSLQLPGVVITAAGTVGKMFAAPQLELTGKAELDAQKMLAQLPPPILKKKIPQDLTAKGQSTVGFKLEGLVKKPDQLSLSADEQISVEVGMKGLTIPLTIQGMVSYAKGDARVEQTLTFPGFKAGLKATLAGVMEKREVDAELESTMKLGEMMPTMIPAQLSEKMNGLEIDGKINLSATLKGEVQKIRQLGLDAAVEMQNGHVAYQGKTLVDQMAWQVAITPDAIVLKQLDAQLAGQSLSGNFKADRFDLRDPVTLKPETMKTRLVWALQSKMLDVDALLALMPAKPDKAKTTTTTSESVKPEPAKPEPDVSSLIPAGLEISGQAELGGLKFDKVKLGKIDFTLEQKNRVLNLKGTIRGYQGQINNTTRLDYSQKILGYAITADVAKVDLEPLLNDVVDTFLAAKLKKPKIIDELKDKITGQLDGKLSLAGKGMRSATALPALNGKGAFTIKAGRLRKFGFQDELAKLFGSAKFSQDIPFDHTVVDFTIGQQKVDVKSFVMESGLQGQSGDIRMTANGMILFNTNFKNFKLRPRLNPRASGSLSNEFGKYSEVLKDEQGWTTLPVILDGPMKKPSVKPDWDWMNGRLRDYAQGKVKSVAKQAETKTKKFVEEQKGKSTKEIQQNMSRELEKAKEKMKDLNLKNLFK